MSGYFPNPILPNTEITISLPIPRWTALKIFVFGSLHLRTVWTAPPGDAPKDAKWRLHTEILDP